MLELIAACDHTPSRRSRFYLRDQQGPPVPMVLALTRQLANLFDTGAIQLVNARGRLVEL